MVRVETSSPGCVYVRLENGIHKFTFLRSNYEAVDEWINHLADANHVTQPHEVQLQLIDMRESGLPPVRYTVRKARQFYAENPRQPRMRIAFLFTPNVLITIARRLLSEFGGADTPRHFFGEHDEKAAINWLLGGRP